MAAIAAKIHLFPRPKAATTINGETIHAECTTSIVALRALFASDSSPYVCISASTVTGSASLVARS